VKPSLKGLRVLNTRPQKQGQLLSERINRAGGLSISCPTLEITDPQTPWFTQVPHLAEEHLAIFTSANAAEYCLKTLNANRISWPRSIHVIAIGQGTEHVLNHYGVEVHSIPHESNSEQLLALPCLHNVSNKNIVLFKGEGGRLLIEADLRKKKANLTVLSVYRRIVPKTCPQFLDTLWHNDSVDIILLTSEQSIKNLFTLFPESAHPWLQSKPCLVISERLAGIASSFGINSVLISHPHALIETLFTLT
jgi:uroporphyrinogen-III synthase